MTLSSLLTRREKRYGLPLLMFQFTCEFFSTGEHTIFLWHRCYGPPLPPWSYPLVSQYDFSWRKAALCTGAHSTMVQTPSFQLQGGTIVWHWMPARAKLLQVGLSYWHSPPHCLRHLNFPCIWSPIGLPNCISPPKMCWIWALRWWRVRAFLECYQTSNPVPSSLWCML